MIGPFRGHYRFLSNFYPSPIRIDRIDYPTAEHAYQASKTRDAILKKEIAACKTPGDAKRKGRQIPPAMMRENWAEERLDCMALVIRFKFNIPEMKKRLLATGDEKLVELNTWHDTFWGVYEGKGENHLGNIIMRERARIREKVDESSKDSDGSPSARPEKAGEPKSNACGGPGPDDNSPGSPDLPGGTPHGYPGRGAYGEVGEGRGSEG